MTSILAWKNLAKSATVTAASTASNMPASNVASDQGSPSTAWQSQAGAVTAPGGALLQVNPSTLGQTWRVIGVFGTNLTANATAVFTLWNNVSSPVLVSSNTLPGPVSGYRQVVLVLPHDTTADYLQVGFNDSNNPDGFINVPLLFCGPAWLPASNAGFSSTVGRDDSTSEVVSRGGQEYPTLLWHRRRWNVSLEGIRSTEMWTQADALGVYAKGGSNVFFAPDTSSANLQCEAIFGRLKATADVSYPYQGADRRRWQMQITERL